MYLFKKSFEACLSDKKRSMGEKQLIVLIAATVILVSGIVYIKNFI